jgi:hypothetical protein
MVDAGRILAAALAETPLDAVTVRATTMRLAGATDSSTPASVCRLHRRLRRVTAARSSRRITTTVAQSST